MAIRALDHTCRRVTEGPGDVVEVGAVVGHQRGAGVAQLVRAPVTEVVLLAEIGEDPPNVGRR